MPSVVTESFFCQHKSDPLVEPVEIIWITLNFVRIRFLNGRQSTVSTKDLAPTPTTDPLIANSDPPLFTDRCESLSPTQMVNDESTVSTYQRESSEDIWWVLLSNQRTRFTGYKATVASGERYSWISPPDIKTRCESLFVTGSTN